MEIKSVNNKGQARLFNSNWLEMLTKTHPLIIWGMYLPVIIYLPLQASDQLNLGLTMIGLIFVAGMFFWTFFEYVMHRFGFHHEAKSERAKRITYVIHGNHHEYPKDKTRLFMPPVPSIIIASILYSIMYVFLQQYAQIFFPGFMLGYLLYASTHYAIHAWSPPFKFLKPIWRNHLLHHYRDMNRGFGVSSPLWDYVFGTTSLLKSQGEQDKTDLQ